MARRGHLCRCCSTIGAALTGFGKSLDAWNLTTATATLTDSITDTYATILDLSYPANYYGGAIKLELANTASTTRLRLTLTTNTYADPYWLPTTQAGGTYRTWTWTAVYENPTVAITSLGEISRLTFTPAMLTSSTHAGDATIIYTKSPLVGAGGLHNQPSTNAAHLGTITLAAVTPIPPLAGRDATLQFSSPTPTVAITGTNCPGHDDRYTLAGVTSRTFETTLTTAAQTFEPDPATLPWISGNINDLFHSATIHNNVAQGRLDVGFAGRSTTWDYSGNANPTPGTNPTPTPAFPCGTGREIPWGAAPFRNAAFTQHINATLYHALAENGPNGTTTITTTVGDPDSPFTLWPFRAGYSSFGYTFGNDHNPITTTITLYPPP